jgi:phosphatidate cytidylyltransferase
MTGANFYPRAYLMLIGLAFCLVVAQLVVRLSYAHPTDPKRAALLDNIAQRIRAWWFILLAIALCVPLGRSGVLLLFFLVSLQCLKEFVSVIPTTTSDHLALVFCFYLLLPLHYLCIALGAEPLVQAVFSGLVGLCLFKVSASTNSHWRYLGVLVCVVALSFLPALLGSQIRLAVEQKMMALGFLLLVVQVSDIAQFICGKAWGRHALAPTLSPGKTWEGLMGGIVCVTLLGAALHWMTPFELAHAAIVAFVLAALGAISGLCLSAVKRRFAVKDWGGLLTGHGGMLDRVDSLVLPAPAFYAYLHWVTISAL